MGGRKVAGFPQHFPTGGEGGTFRSCRNIFFFFNATVLAARRWRAQPLSIAFLVAHATYWQALHAEEAYCEHLEILHLDLCSFQFLP